MSEPVDGVTRPIEVLLIEDVLADVRLTKEALRESRVPIRLEVASDGFEGLAILRREGKHADAPRPDFILLDLNLPGIDGREVLARINADEDLRTIPTIILTMSDAEVDVVRSYQLQAAAYLGKPVTLAAFEGVMTTIKAVAQTRVAVADQGPTRLLLVEDNPGDARLLREMLKEDLANAISLVHVENMVDAEKVLVKGVTDIILLDLGLPDAQGLGALRWARTAAPSVPLVVLTGLDDDHLARQALQEGAQDFLIKGDISARGLLRALRYSIERKAMSQALFVEQERASHASEHDFLTGLPNRLLLHDRISQAIAAAPRHRKQVAVLFLDLDGFKHINDSLGHRVGDELLRSVATRLGECVRTSDTVSRQGGDEFVVLLSEAEQWADAAAVARRMLEAVAAPHSVDNKDLHITTSIGISVFPDDGENAETLIQNADTAMYQAKENGRAAYQFFKPDMNVRAVERQSIEEDLRRALDRNEFELHYQPKVDLRTGQITGAEALIRWTHPKRGPIPPIQFIPIAEDSGLIVPIGHWVMRRACEQTRAWADAGWPNLSMAVNVSAMELRDEHFLDGIFAILRDTGVDPSQLELELTESVLLKHAGSAALILQALRERGIRLAIDDFGTGYSSLSYLKKLPIDALKIDQSFVRQLGGDGEDTAIVTAIIGMARSLRLRVIAEGVETPEQLAFLQANACDEAQGYQFSRPISAAAFESLLRIGIEMPLTPGVDDALEVIGVSPSATLADPGRAVVRSSHAQRLGAERALTQSESRFRTSIESMLDPFAILTAVRDGNGAIVDFVLTFGNEPLGRLFGLSEQDRMTGRLLSILPAHARNGLFERYCEVVATGDPRVEDRFTYEDRTSGGRIDLVLDLRIVKLGDGVAVTGREIGEFVRTQVALTESEERFRLLAERSHDVIYRVRFLPIHTVEYVSPSIERLSGYSPAEMYADPDLAAWMTHPDDRPELAARFTDGRLFTEPMIHRWVRKDGSIVWVEQSNTQILDEHGTRIAMEGVVRDITTRIAAEEAIRASETRFRTALDGLGLHALILDSIGRILFINRHMLELTGWAATDVLGADVFARLAPNDGRRARREAYRKGVADGVVVEHDETTWMTRSGKSLLISWHNSSIQDDAGTTIAVVAVGEDVTARRRSEVAQARLVAAVEQVTESIVLTDLDGRVTYANPAYERASGNRLSEVVGAPPEAVFRGPGADTRHRTMARQLQAGHPWTGERDLERRDGTIYREEVTISPIRDSDGTVDGYVRVGRDVTDLREIQASLDHSTRDRGAFAHALSLLQPRETVEATGQDITAAIVGLTGIDAAAIVLFEAQGDVRVLAVTAPDGYPFVTGQRLPIESATYLAGRATDGPWIESRVGHTRDDEYTRLLDQMGTSEVAYAPIGTGAGVIGLIAIAIAPDEASSPGKTVRQLWVATEFAAAANSLIGGMLADRRVTRATGLAIETTVASGAFESVFQPIVELESGAPVGFEALTRFVDGRNPDVVFAEAEAVGLGLELETATLERAIASSHALPAGPWLSVNVSARMVLDADRLASILRARRGPIVLEVTEHDVITDYGAVRAAITLLGPDVRLAVDDAGAGVANFTHIVSLQPDFVKIDVGLVRGVDADLTRQALIVGLKHFAQATDGWIVAEGVETDEERQTLIDLGLHLGQGNLFGRPASASYWTPGSVKVKTRRRPPMRRASTRRASGPGRTPDRPATPRPR